MSLDEIRKQLERLNRAPLGDGLHPASEPPAGWGRGSSPAPNIGLEALIPGQVIHLDGTSAYQIDRLVGQSWKPGRAIFDRLREALADPRTGQRAENLHAELRNVVRAPTGTLLFVDLETCGFAGTPVFLIGVMYFAEDDFRIEQLLARTYAEENGIVARFARILADHPHLVTFNGKSFDWPFLADRAAICHISLPRPGDHCDLLHIARRRFKDCLPDCKLQTLERYICGRRRVGDIPGSEIPGAYHEFVRTGDARQLRDILHHNFLDLTTMADVLTELLC